MDDQSQDAPRPGPLDPHELYALVCREVARDMVISLEERELLNRLRKLLRIHPNRAEDILQSQEAEGLGIDEEDEPRFPRADLEPARCFRSACEAAWRDGVLEPGERQLLYALARLLRIPAGTARQLLDETYLARAA